MLLGLAEADGPFRQTLDCLNLRGQRSGESAGGGQGKPLLLLQMIGFIVNDE